MTTVREDLMAAEVWEAVLDYTPEMAELLGDGLLHALIYDAPVGGNLVYPPLVLRRMVVSEERIVIGGVGPLWHLGVDEVGPMIANREYVAGTNKLSNPSFALDVPDLYWRLPSSDSRWLFSAGNATNAGGAAKDDVLESDERFPLRPGQTFQIRALGVTGTGRLRVRAFYEGSFDPSNLLLNPGMESGATGWATTANISIVTSGARTGTYAMRIGPIPKPDLIPSALPATLGSTFTIVGGKLRAAGNPQPQYVTSPGLEDGGTGWSEVTGATATDMAVQATAEALEGSYAMRAGPNAHVQRNLNPKMDSLTNWVFDGTHPPSTWHVDTTNPAEGTGCITTAGQIGGVDGPSHKRLWADTTAWPPGWADGIPVTPGETYKVAGFIRKWGGTDGYAYIGYGLKHPTNPAGDVWAAAAPTINNLALDEAWYYVETNEFTVPPNRTTLHLICDVFNHTTGWYSFDYTSLTRTKGNTARMEHATTHTVVPGTQYAISAMVRSDDSKPQGDVRLGVTLSGPGKTPYDEEETQGETDYQWGLVRKTFTPRPGYTTAKRYVRSVDVLGGSFWVDFFQLHKTSGNTDTSTFAPFAVVPDQRYLLSADVASVNVPQGGTVSVGVKLTGAGVTVTEEEVTWTVGENGVLKADHKEIRPPPGYTTATVYVRSTDIQGDTGYFELSNFHFIKMDNNSDSSENVNIAAVPERTYRWTQAVRSGPALQRGTVKLSVRCARTGYPDVVFDSSPMEATANAWKFIDFSFTPPSGYLFVYPSIVGTDVEGDYWYVDDGDIRDTDSASYVVDTLMDSPAASTGSLSTTAPAGAEFIRVLLVAEQGTSNWTVGEVSLARTGVTPATGNAIVADLLKDPETGAPLSISAGTLSAPAVIPYDWVVQNRTNRNALDHLCNVVYDGGLQYKINATLPATIDVAPDPFTDRTGIVLIPEDRDVQDLTKPETDVEKRATEIWVFGAERQTVSGRPILITATAQVPGSTEFDFNGRPIKRPFPVTDATIDHFAYAQAYADDLALRESEPALNLSVKLSGRDTRPVFTVGDHIYVYHPESGLEDPTYAQSVNGQTVFPQRVRVLSRERALGPSYRIVMRRSDGTTFPLTGLHPADEDATVLTIGDRLPEWEADPQGFSASVQAMRDRVSRPR